MFDLFGTAARKGRAEPLLTEHLRLYQHLPYALPVTDEVVRTRDDGLVLSMEVQGIDPATASSFDVIAIRDSLNRVLASLDGRITIHMHRMLVPDEQALVPVGGGGFSGELDRRWRAHLQNVGMMRTALILTVVRHNIGPVAVPFLRKTAAKVIREDLTRRMADLTGIAEILETALSGARLKRLKLSDGGLIGFFTAISTGRLETEYAEPLTLLAEASARFTLRFGTRHFRIGGIVDERYGAILHIAGMAEMTEPGILSAFDEERDLVVSHSFTPIDRASIIGRVRRRIQQMRSTDDLARTIEAQLLDAADAVETGSVGFGTHQMAITVFGDSIAHVDKRLKDLRGRAQLAGFRAVQEEVALEATFFACHPGNDDYRCRDSIVSTANFADMAALHMSSSGAPRDRLPWQTPISIFRTIGKTGHAFSFHPQGDPRAEPTNGHTLVLGPPGSGKTATIAFLAAQAQRAGARIVIFDKDQGLKMAVHALGGQYAEVKAGVPTGLNPLSTETGERGRAWLIDWIASLVEREERLSPIQADTLKNAVRQNDMAPAQLRTFRNFQSLFGDVGDDRTLARLVAEWGPEGRYSWVFGEADRPLVDFSSADVTGVDMTEILDLKAERAAVLSYLFRRIEGEMDARKPLIVIIDEAWKMLDDEGFSRKLKDWLVTARKKNAVVIMMTQTPNQIRESGAASVISSLPNRLIFPNRNATAQDYADHRLTDAELGFVLDAAFGQRQVLFKAAEHSTILDVDLAALGHLLTALGGGRAGEAAFGADYWKVKEFWNV